MANRFFSLFFPILVMCFGYLVLNFPHAFDFLLEYQGYRKISFAFLCFFLLLIWNKVGGVLMLFFGFACLLYSAVILFRTNKPNVVDCNELQNDNEDEDTKLILSAVKEGFINKLWRVRENESK